VADERSDRDGTWLWIKSFSYAGVTVAVDLVRRHSHFVCDPLSHWHEANHLALPSWSLDCCIVHSRSKRFSVFHVNTACPGKTLINADALTKMGCVQVPSEAPNVDLAD